MEIAGTYNIVYELWIFGVIYTDLYTASVLYQCSIFIQNTTCIYFILSVVIHFAMS
jgi:hypothetical protein